jgi:putative DNA primase/helicase
VESRGGRGRHGGRNTDIGGQVAYSLTDCGNAERLVEQFGEGIRFCRVVREWFVWRRPVWTADPGAVVQLAKKAVRTLHLDRRALLGQVEEFSDTDEILRLQADALSKWARHSEGAQHIAAMVRLAESDPRVCVSPGDFDRNPWALNVLNGTVDLRTGRQESHRPEDLITNLAPITFEPNAKCERWLQFLEEVFKPHPEVIPFLQRAIGYSLTGDVREECIFVLLGKGRNGKGTLINVLHDLLGSYGGVAEIETFLISHHGSLREDIADMQGRRFISAQEPA